jgi:lysophospholipase L1-like esterase
MKRRRESLFRGVAIVVGILLGIAGFEVGLRLAQYDTRSLDGIDPVHQAIFGEVDVNALGFRDAALDLPALRRQGVLVAIGDSYTFGSGIVDAADRYTDRLSEELGVPVLNLGVPGRDFPSHATAGDKAIAVIRPRGIILQFTMNDVAAYAAAFGCTNPAIWSLPASWQPLAKRSYLMVVLNRASAGLLSRFGRLPSYEEWLICVHRDPSRPGYQHFLREYATTVETWLRQVDFVLLLIWPWHTETEPYPFRHVHELLADTVRASGGQVLDLFEAMHHMPVAKLRLNDHDAHPNEDANALAAAALAQHLRNRGLLRR